MYLQLPLLQLEQKFDHFDFPYALEWAKLAVGACHRQCGEYPLARKMAVEVLNSMRTFVIHETDVPAPALIGRTQYLDILRRAAAFTFTVAEVGSSRLRCTDLVKSLRFFLLKMICLV